MNVVTCLMTSSDVFFVVIVALIINASTAFSLYDVSELPVFDKRGADIGSRLWEILYDDNDAEPLITDHVYNTSPTIYDYQAVESNEMIPRRKRYTEYQENSLAMCAGECMYMHRTFYGECYELCNWNGLTASPWKKLEKQSLEQQRMNVSRVPTHRFGPPTNQHSSTLKATVSSPAVHQGNGAKIKIVAGRPMKSRQLSVNSKQQPANSKQSKVTATVAAPGGGRPKGKSSKIGKCHT